jgi:phage tail sheath protein FI
MSVTIKTPGVYINEINAFPNSVVSIATTVPAFIGYTPQAEYQGKSYYNKSQKITSFTDFKAIYMIDGEQPQYKPNYYLIEQKQEPENGFYITVSGKHYVLLPDQNTLYYLYNSIRLFYQNGGGDAYIVAVGECDSTSVTPKINADNAAVNQNVKLSDLLAGLNLLKSEQEPTLYICPEATLLSVDDNGTLMQGMLLQAQTMQTVMCLFDVIGGKAPNPILYSQDIDTFRNNTGTKGLKYGATYYPFVGTTMMQSDEVSYKNLFGGNIKQLQSILSPQNNKNPAAEKVIAMMEVATEPSLTTNQLHQALLNASPTYGLIINHVLKNINILPPSGGMAGIYNTIDNQIGVWNAPANVSMEGVTELPIKLSDSQQVDLNIDAVSGKSINAIRFFNGQGILVWGARTLEGNSQDWRYISVRRTMTFLEQSIKQAAKAYVFEPNDANTWAAVKNMISSFLTSIWKEGGLMGAQPADAFQVDIGLGTTMTAEDLLNGVMNVTIKVAVARPAEFIVITFQQEMAESG